MKSYKKDELSELWNSIGILDSPDPYLKKDVLECLIDVKRWSYYSKVRDNEPKHGKIMASNSQIEIITECLHVNKSAKRYYKIWKKYPNSYIYWKGDVSEKRLKYLLDLSAMDGVVQINVPHESGELAYQMINGTFQKVK